MIPLLSLLSTRCTSIDFMKLNNNDKYEKNMYKNDTNTQI